jgi:transcriptional regulator with AAA-type ATPase domain
MLAGMDMLELYRCGELLARYELGDRAIEVGRALACDVALEDPELAERHWLLLKRRGTVVAFDVSAGKRQRAIAYPMPLGRSVPLGRLHALRRVDAEPSAAPTVDRQTDGLSHAPVSFSDLVVIVGRGSDAPRLRVDELPIQIGRAPDNDIKLLDRAVSDRHVRLEPCAAGLSLRDLGSRNGTFVNGVRVQSAIVGDGTLIRVGRSELRIRGRVQPQDGAPTMVAESSSMLDVLSEVRRIASLPWPVLVTGESGTGKEGIALALHASSARASQAFVAVNAGGLSRELVESELFGHERGAFTGAAARHRGVFEQAHGGTLFLDEIAELPADLQARLLRVLETGEVRRVGSEAVIHVDVRLVCATHRNLREMVLNGSFRQDLYYRVARLVIEVPSLRVRPEDLRVLTRHFLAEISQQLGARELAPEALIRLQAYSWPGNVRELRNVLSVAAAAAGARIEAHDIEAALLRVGGAPSTREVTPEAIRRALAECAGNHAATARALGIPRSTLRDRLKGSR